MVDRSGAPSDRTIVRHHNAGITLPSVPDARTWLEQSLRLRGLEELSTRSRPVGIMGSIEVAIKREDARRNHQGCPIRRGPVPPARPSPRLNETRYPEDADVPGRILPNDLKKMRNSSDSDLKKLAVELGRYRRSSVLTVQAIFGGHARQHQVRADDQRFCRPRDRRNQSIRSNDCSVQVQRSRGSSEVRRWAAQSLDHWDQFEAGNACLRI